MSRWLILDDWCIYWWIRLRWRSCSCLGYPTVKHNTSADCCPGVGCVAEQSGQGSVHKPFGGCIQLKPRLRGCRKATNWPIQIFYSTGYDLPLIFTLLWLPLAPSQEGSEVWVFVGSMQVPQNTWWLGFGNLLAWNATKHLQYINIYTSAEHIPWLLLGGVAMAQEDHWVWSFKNISQ